MGNMMQKRKISNGVNRTKTEGELWNTEFKLNLTDVNIFYI